MALHCFKFPALRRSRDGFVLITTAVCLPVIVGMLGLTVDVGRLYIVKNELQTFVDSAAIAAASALDGTTQGITNAIAIAQAGLNGGTTPNRWNFATQTVAPPQVTFAQTIGGTYTASPASGADYLFAQVAAAQTVTLYFLPLFPGVSASRSVSAVSIAGQAVRSNLGDGLSPFSPDAHNATDANFGFVRGTQYTLRWAPEGQRKNNTCAGDLGFTPGGGISDRGYIDVGQGTGTSDLRSTVVNNDFFFASPFVVGDTITTLTGNSSIPSSVDERIAQDTDLTSNTYATYHGNGRRIIIVPVNNGGGPGVIIGFAAFFYPPRACGNSNVAPCCAEYIGSGVLGTNHRGGSSSGGLYTVKLFQ